MLSKIDKPAAPQRWLRHYRKVQPAFLSRLGECGLDRLLLIPEVDFRRCVDHGG